MILWGNNILFEVLKSAFLKQQKLEGLNNTQRFLYEEILLILQFDYCENPIPKFGTNKHLLLLSLPLVDLHFFKYANGEILKYPHQ